MIKKITVRFYRYKFKAELFDLVEKENISFAFVQGTPWNLGLDTKKLGTNTGRLKMNA